MNRIAHNALSACLAKARQITAEPQDAVYLNIVPPKNDGSTVCKLDIKNVPVDRFWSISVYDAQGYFVPNQLNAYSLNNITAKKNADGSVPVQFGGCEGNVPNCLPIMGGWNYMVRLYRSAWRGAERKVEVPGGEANELKPVSRTSAIRRASPCSGTSGVGRDGMDTTRLFR